MSKECEHKKIGHIMRGDKYTPGQKKTAKFFFIIQS